MAVYAANALSTISCMVMPHSPRYLYVNRQVQSSNGVRRNQSDASSLSIAFAVADLLAASGSPGKATPMPFPPPRMFSLKTEITAHTSKKGSIGELLKRV